MELRTHLALLALLAAAGCAAQSPPAAPAASSPRAVVPSGSAAQQRAAIETLIAAPRCDSSAQCRSLALGSRLCGGAEQYLPYSTKVSDAEQLERLAQSQRAARHLEQQASGRMGICQVLPDPGAQCSAQGLCELRPPQ